MRMPRVGETVAERYCIVEELGRGGMGVVFAVHHSGIDREFAMKVLSPKLSLDEQYRTRFMREAKINARLSHPNVVQVYDSGVHEELLYIVMERLSGKPLSDLLYDGEVGELPDVVRIGAQLAEALQAAHAIGLVHRDLKTDNVFIERPLEREARRCVLLDFGLAYIEQSEELGRLTRDSDTHVAGTPLYMSPEQVSAAPLTSATDIYSLGCMLYELLSGETPFEGDEATLIRVMTRHLFAAPKPLRHKVPQISTDLEQLVMAMLNKDPELRPTAAEIALELRDLAHAPSLGRGGALRSRARRQVQGPTERDERLKDTRDFSTLEGSTRASTRALGLWGLSVDESHQIGLAAAGFQAHSVEREEDLARMDLLLVSGVTLEELARARGAPSRGGLG